MRAPAGYITVAMVTFLCPVSVADLHVSPDGDDTATGTRAAPFASVRRARDAIRQLKDGAGLPAGGVTVWVHGGLYRFSTPLELEARDSGSAGSPITYRAALGESVVFDGSRRIDTSDFRAVAGDPELSRLAPPGRGHVLSCRIADTEAARQLGAGGVLSLNGRMMQYARFPNRGFAHLGRIVEKGVVYAHGRTKGDPPPHSMEEPIGGKFAIREAPSGDWEAEYRVSRSARVTGYLAYDWYRQNHAIARIDDGVLTLREYSRYGLRDAGEMPRRLVVTGLLCEVDQPGEWAFDSARRTLYVWPFEPLNAASSLGLWAGPSFAVLREVSYVTIRGFTIMGVADARHKAAVHIVGGSHNTIAGCTLKNSTRTAVCIDGGTHNGIRSCDIYDVTAHLNMTGGDTKSLTPSRNFAINCHFTQVQATDFYGRVAARGIGDIFRNNLVHNFIGQPITPGGNDQIIELNEVFNVGFEEGDGGAMYTAQAVWGGYGQVFRHNFLHHLMCVPRAHPRGGIYLDQLYGGSLIEENVFCKAAHRAVLVNGGAGTTVRRNVFIDGHIGIYNTSAYGQRSFEDIVRFDSGELRRGDVGDYIWRTEQAVGAQGWNSEPWASRFPMFRRIMNQPRMRFFPIESAIVGNLFHGNVEDIQWRTGWGKDDLTRIEDIPYVRSSGNREVDMALFVDPTRMHFAFRRTGRPPWAPDIPFDQIGLYRDEDRPTVPDKAAYRMAVRERFRDRRCYDPDAVYDPDTINDVLYFNTGKLLMEGVRTDSDRGGGDG